MAGGFAILKDVPKTLVYQLVRYRNSLAVTTSFPRASLDKPPSPNLETTSATPDCLPPMRCLTGA
jgi:NAD+ synthase (glutamine-hydrolysing)